MTNDKLIVYKKEGCFKCEQVMRMLEAKGYSFEKRMQIDHMDEVEDYPYYSQNLYPIMKMNGKYVTFKELLQKK